MLPTMTANVPNTSSSPKNQSPRDQASLTFETDEIEADEAEQGERTHERWAGVGAPLLVQWPLERKTLVGARPVVWSRRQDDQLCQGAPPLRQIGQRAEDGQQRIDLDALTCRVELAVLEGAQWQMVAGAQLERGRGDLLVGPDLDGIAVSGRSPNGRDGEPPADRRRRAGRRRAAVHRALVARDKKTALVGVADDLQRHWLWRALSSGYQRAEEVLG